MTGKWVADEYGIYCPKCARKHKVEGGRAVDPTKDVDHCCICGLDLVVPPCIEKAKRTKKKGEKQPAVCGGCGKWPIGMCDPHDFCSRCGSVLCGDCVKDLFKCKCKDGNIERPCTKIEDNI